ncbi:hypothetical protein HK103_000490 [Boothiomyces macroporosus]|uniref:Uncharacterized protein n=1 Tax=Boothiomyces macroporosus TaxID=261099 RepID=A0AAD5UF51_9FUNG|nr:hypothetical protein HK103_000490 [Boothiomyces macroporosus]
MSYNHRQGSGVGENTNANLISSVGSAVNYSIVINGKANDFKDAKDSLQQVSSSIPILNAHTVTYPFDTYDTVVSVLVKDFSSQKPIPFSYDFSGAIDLWRSDIETYSGDIFDGPPEERLFSVTLSRTYITIVFSIFLYAIMWVLSGSAFLVILSIWTRGRKVEPPTIAAVGAILFALPNIRNAQPGAPAVGCNADIAAFFPCLILVTASVALGLINYFTVYKAESKPVRADANQAPLFKNDTIVDIESIKERPPSVRSVQKQEKTSSVKSVKKEVEIATQPKPDIQYE